MEAAPLKSREVRIGTLNVNSREMNYQAFTQLVTQYSIDVLSLNECTRKMARKIHFELGYNYVYTQADFAGNALFSRFPIEESKELTTSETGGEEMRSAAAAVLHVGLGDEGGSDGQRHVLLPVMALHLSHIHEADRIRQMKQLLSEVFANVL